jgi:hypothetical protein
MPSDLPFCPNCGSRNEPGTAFCGNCGTSMDQIIPAASVAGPPFEPPLERRGRPWLLRLVTVVAVAVVAAVFASGQQAKILNLLKHRTSPAPIAQPVAPASPPQAAPPVAPASPPPAAPPSVAVTKFDLTSLSAASAQGGLRVKMSGAFLLSGAPPQTVAKVAPVWVVGSGKRQYGSATSVPVKNGPVKVSAAALIARAAPSDYIECSLSVWIAAQEFLSPAKGLAVSSVVPAPSRPAKPPTPPAPVLGPTPFPPSSPPPLTQPPAPSQPPAPTPPAAPLAPAVSVTNLTLTPTSSVTVASEGTVSFNLSFVLAGPQQTTIESMVAWRGPDGTLRYGHPVLFPAVPGTNTYRGLSFTVTADMPPGTIVPVYGALKIGDRVYQSQLPVRITVAAIPRPTPPAGEAPPVRQPPLVQPAPPRFARGAICGFWHSDYGDVTFRCPANQEEGPVRITGTWRQAPGKWGQITGGTFDPSTGIITFDYYEPWVDVSGSARLKLEPGATKITGTWQQTNGSGTWTMWR